MQVAVANYNRLNKLQVVDKRDTGKKHQKITNASNAG